MSSLSIVRDFSNRKLCPDLKFISHSYKRHIRPDIENVFFLYAGPYCIIYLGMRCAMFRGVFFQAESKFMVSLSLRLEIDIVFG